MKTFARCLLCAVLPLLSSCRLRSPAERHWLRVPAQAADGLSGIDRSQWLHGARGSLPGARELKASGHLHLPPQTTPRGTQYAGAEVVVFPGTDTEGIAVITRRADNGTARLQLLVRHGGTYTDHSAVIPGGPVAADWQVRGGSVTGGRGTVMWSGGQWRRL